MNHFEVLLENLKKTNRLNELPFLITKYNKKILFKRKTQEELKNYLPKILENTNSSNYEWIRVNKNLILENKKIWIENIDKIDFNQDKEMFDTIVTDIIYQDLTEEEILLLMDNIIKCNVNLEEYDVDSLMKLIKKENIKQQEMYLEKYLNNQNTCLATASYIIHNKKEHLDLIKNNIDNIIQIDNIDFFSLKEILKDEEQEIDKIKKKIQTNPETYTKIMIKNLYKKITTKIKRLLPNEEKKLGTITEVIYLILEDISKNEKKSLSEINIIGEGTYSTVIGLGNKVIKIGTTRMNKVYPNNPYINAILLRKEFTIKDKLSIFVEVNEKVDTKTEITEEELYQLYKKIRELGLIWLDVGYRNVGRLIQDNKIHWEKNLNPSNEAIGLSEYIGKEELKKGDIVIIDNDYIFREHEIDKVKNISSFRTFKRFEKRYQEEKQEAALNHKTR